MVRILLLIFLSVAFLNGPCAAQTIPTNGLVAWYPFNGNANDQSGNSLNGIVNGATLTSDRFGNQNSAYDFNGINDFIQVAHSTLINFDVNEEFTISLWTLVRTPTTNNGVVDIFGKWEDFPGGNNDSYPYAIRIKTNSPTGAPQFLRYDKNCGNFPFYTHTNSILNTGWRHLTFVKSGSNLKVYLDCILIASFLDITLCSTTNTSPVYIGKRGGTLNPSHFNGIIDDISIYNRALDDCEIPLLCDLNINLSNSDTIDKCLSENVSLSTDYSNPQWFLDGNFYSNSSTINYNGDTGVVFLVNGTDQYGCIHKDTIDVRINGRPNKLLYLGKCKEDSFLLIQPDTLSNVKWYKNGTLFASDTDSLVLTDTVSTLIVLEGLDASGCLIRDTFVISSLNPKSEIDDYEKLICHSTKDSRIYNIVGNGFSQFIWSITGGEIIENEGLSVKINWNDIDQASLKVVEISPNGCISDTLEFEFENDISSIGLDLISFSEDFAWLEIKGNAETSEGFKNIHLLNSNFDTSSIIETKSFQFLTDTAIVNVEESFKFNALDKCENRISSDSVKPILISYKIDDANSIINLSWENLSIWKKNEINNEIYELKSNSNKDLIARIGYDSIFSVLFSKKDFKRCFYVESRNSSFDLLSRSNLKCIELEGELFIPNIITPNGDGFNDYLEIENLSLFQRHRFEIYNRYGKKVFQSSDYQNDWSGSKLSSGVYFFRLQVENQKIQDYKGYIHLMR